MRLNEFTESMTCSECGGPAFTDLILAEKKDACYSKVRSRYKVWPSAYASGALVQCRKKGAANWGNSKSEGVAEGNYDRDDYYNARRGSEYGRGLAATGYGGDGSGTRRDDIFKGQSKRLPADPFARTTGAVPKTGTGRIHSTALPGEMDEGLGSKLAGLGLAGAMALGSAGANARVTPDGQGGYTGGFKPAATAPAADVKPAAPASHSFSKEYLQRAADPNRTGRYMISVEKAQELLSNMQEGADKGQKIGNMDADDFDAAMSRLKKLAGAGPMKTVYDPQKRVYKNMPTAQQPAQQPKK